MVCNRPSPQAIRTASRNLYQSVVAAKNGRRISVDVNPHSNENEVRCLTGCLTGLVGAVAGAWFFLLLYERWMITTQPNLRSDGMEGLFLFPAGGLVGGILGFCLPYWLPRRKS